MRSKNYKGCKCIKKKVSKCEEVVRTYDAIQTAYVDVLDQDDSIRAIKCNVILDDIEKGLFQLLGVPADSRQRLFRPLAIHRDPAAFQFPVHECHRFQYQLMQIHRFKLGFPRPDEEHQILMFADKGQGLKYLLK